MQCVVCILNDKNVKDHVLLPSKGMMKTVTLSMTQLTKSNSFHNIFVLLYHCPSKFKVLYKRAASR